MNEKPLNPHTGQPLPDEASQGAGEAPPAPGRIEARDGASRAGSGNVEIGRAHV